MDYSKKWKIIDILGEGGQGKVYRVFKLDIDSKIKSSVIDTLKNIVISTTKHETTKGNYERFFETVATIQSIFDVFWFKVPIFQRRNLNLCWRLSKCLDQANT